MSYRVQSSADKEGNEAEARKNSKKSRIQQLSLSLLRPFLILESSHSSATFTPPPNNIEGQIYNGVVVLNMQQWRKGGGTREGGRIRTLVTDNSNYHYTRTTVLI